METLRSRVPGHNLWGLKSKRLQMQLIHSSADGSQIISYRECYSCTMLVILLWKVTIGVTLSQGLFKAGEVGSGQTLQLDDKG